MSFDQPYRAVLLCVALLATNLAEAALEASMEVRDSNGNLIAGGNTKGGREGTFAISELHHLLRRESGTTDHEPLIVTVQIGQGLPALLEAMDSGDRLTATITFYRISPEGLEQPYYRIGLRDALIIAVEPLLPDTQDPDFEQMTHRARLRLDYRSLVHEFESSETVILENR